MSAIQSVLSKAIRVSGQALDAIGQRFEVNPYIEKLQPSLRSVKLGGSSPVISQTFVASSATIVGKVKIDKNSSVWYGAIVRGDVNSVTIGEGVSVGDRVMIHCSSNRPTVIGSHSVIGAGAIVHGCNIGTGSLLGEGAQVLDGASVGSGSILGAGSVLSPGKSVPPGQLWSGVPAVFRRALTEQEVQTVAKLALENAELASIHFKESVKSWESVEDEELDFEQRVGRNSAYYQRLGKEELAVKLGEVENHMVPGRILDSPVSSREQAESRPTK